MKYLLSMFLLIGWAAARGQTYEKIDSIIAFDSLGNTYIAPLDSLGQPILDKTRWRGIPSITFPIVMAYPDAWNGNDTPRRGWGHPSSTPRLDALELQVQYLLRRTNELEAEIKALSGVKEDTTYHMKTTEFGRTQKGLTAGSNNFIIGVKPHN